MHELMDAIDSNFEGKRGEQIRQMCLAAPKFGNGLDEADLMVRDVGSFSASVILSYDNSPYARFHISREGLSWHYFGGLGVGALPNGRKSKRTAQRWLDFTYARHGYLWPDRCNSVGAQGWV